jgi:hypothetical protein
VVRYILNVPGLLGGDKQYDPKEILFSYTAYNQQAAGLGCKVDWSKVPILKIPMIEDFFKDVGAPRTYVCFWVGKGRNLNNPINRTAMEITYDWP